MPVVPKTGLEPAPGFKLGRLLGTGGFGEVWEGTAPDGSTVALKYIDCRSKAANVVVNEIRFLSSLRELKHPHLIEVHNIFVTSNFIVISMERAEGSLADLHKAYNEEMGTHVPPDHLLEVLGQTAEALDFLASRKLSVGGFAPSGFQHCDVKPRNLLMVGDVLKVADLGLCTQHRANSRSTGSFMGTPPYAAPEMYEGRTTERTDQFALGVTYCELRAGRFPFHLSDRLSTKHLGKAPDLSMLPDPEQSIVARSLEPKWYDRWPSCTAFIDALRPVAGTTALPAPNCMVAAGRASSRVGRR